MIKFKLRGLAEGVVGRPEVSALSAKDLFKKFPELNNIKKKLTLKKGHVAGFAACDG